MAIPKNITKEHIKKAIQEIIPAQIPTQRLEQNYSLISEGKTLPPKYVISIANKYANGSEFSRQGLQQLDRQPAGNSGLAKKPNLWFFQKLCFLKTFVVADNFVQLNRLLRQAANLWWQLQKKIPI